MAGHLPIRPLERGTQASPEAGVYHRGMGRYSLKTNTAARVGSMDKAKRRGMLFWTQTLCWTSHVLLCPWNALLVRYQGRELLALTSADFDVKRGTASSSKSYQRRKDSRRPQTPKSNRVIKMPSFLM